MHIFIGSTHNGFKMYLSNALSGQYLVIIMAKPINNSTANRADDYVLMNSGPMLASEIVAAWMDTPERTAKEIEAARIFLGINIA